MTKRRPGDKLEPIRRGPSGSCGKTSKQSGELIRTGARTAETAEHAEMSAGGSPNRRPDGEGAW